MRRLLSGACAAFVGAILLIPAAASADFTVPPPPIDAGLVSVDGISLNGHAGNTLTVAPGADVRITGTATDKNTGCRGCIMYANVGFRGAAASAGCFGDFMRLDVPGFATATGTVDLGNAPTTLGFYDIVVQGQAQFSCGPGWAANGGTTIAQIRVQPPDFNVGAPPIDAGSVSVDGISLNGHAGNTLTVAPGADVRITGTATDKNTGCRGCIMYANVAFRGAAASAGCFGDFMRLDVPGFATATGTVDLGNAPTTLGFYDIVVQGQAQFSCGPGWAANGGTTIAQIRVQPPDFNVGAPPIDAGSVSVDGISLNGHAGNTLTVAPGADVRITGTATDKNTGCRGCIMYADVGFRGAAASAGCFGDFMRLDVPGFATATGTVDLGNAPTTLGFYDIVVEGQAQFTCGPGWSASGGTTIAQIRVVAPPVCPAVTSSTPYATPVTITLACTGTTLAYTVGAGGAPAHGTLGAIGGNQVSYTPAAGFSGTDTFHLTATDAAGSTAAETVRVDVGGAPPSPPSSPPAPPSPSIAAPPTPLPLACSGHSITLLQVGIAGGKVQLTGLTLRAFAGKTVTLIAHPGGTVGTAVVRSDGTFSAKVKRPSAKILAKVRYEAVLGTAHSARFRPLRQITITSRTSNAAGTTIRAKLTGRVAPNATLTVYRQLTCSTRTVFKRIRVPRSHKLKITLPRPPSSAPVAYYQLVIKVARNSTSRPTTATLPVAVTAA